MHLSMADDPDPMCWVLIPVEAIPQALWKIPQSNRRAGWRKQERDMFKMLATPREKAWVDKLRSMWPKGWNSLYPGRPARCGHPQMGRATLERVRAQSEEAAERGLEAAKTAIDNWKQDSRMTQRWLHGADRVDLVEILEGLTTGLCPSQQSTITVAIAVETREVLRKRKLEKKPRDFVKLIYGHRIAAALDLLDIFHDPEVYSLHPEPDVGAAIMIVHKFAPQIATQLFNCKD